MTTQDAVARKHASRSLPPSGQTQGLTGVVASDTAEPVALLGQSPVVRAAREAVLRAASGEEHVLIVAEAGLEAEEIARVIYLRSSRTGAPFVLVDCASCDPTSLEATLFGTSAFRHRGRQGGGATALERVGPDGCIRAARGGVLVLANVVELPASVQSRLARLVRDGEMMVGRAARPAVFDVRLVATGPPTIDTDVLEGRFRSDLLRRLAGVRIDVPALRQRPEDLPVVAARLLEASCRAAGVASKHLTQAAVALVGALPWRGNIGELRAVMDRLVRGVSEEVLQVEHLLGYVRWEGSPGPVRPNGTLREARRQFEREYVKAVLERHAWRMGAAARELGILRPNLYRKVRQLGLLRASAPRGRST